jgi:hypothetical protein
VNRVKHWLLLDLGLVLLLTCHRGAMVVAAGLLALHGAMVIRRFIHPEREAWSSRRNTLVRNFALHYLLTGLASLPLAVLILRNPVFPVENFQVASLWQWLRAVGLGGGNSGAAGLLGGIFSVIGWLLALPGILLLVARANWRAVAPPLAALATVVITVLISFAPGGFKFSGLDLAGMTIAGVALGLGAALSMARRPVRLTICMLLGLGWILSGVPSSGPNLAIRDAMVRVQQVRQPGEDVLVWPPYLATALEYYFGSSAGLGDLAGYFTAIEEPGPGTRVHVVLVRWPEDNARTITLRGALVMHSREAEVWRGSSLLSEVITVRDMNRQSMAAWHADPRTLDTDDKPVPRLTMYLWTPTDDLFTKSAMFHDSPAEALFEPSGRRVAWTRREDVLLEPRVSLPAGSYYLKMHCAPSPEDGPSRSVDVTLSAFDRRRFQVDGETTLSLPFTTATDLDRLPIRINARPLMTAGTGKYQRRQGLKIYSISVEPTSPLN